MTLPIRICIKGHLEQKWAAWLEMETMLLHADGTTEITGTVRDQAALHGLLCRIRDLGMPLLYLQVADEPAASQKTENNGN